MTYQRVEAIGYLGRDPETRYTRDGSPVTNFSVAASERWKNKQGEQQERTEWINCVAFGRLAEICGEYLKKGSRVFIAGKMNTEKWEKDGVTRYTTKVIVGELKMLSSKDDGQRSDQRQESAPQTLSEDDFDDDIPFGWVVALLPMAGMMTEVLDVGQTLL